MVCIPNLSRLRLSTLTIATNTETSSPQKRPHESSDSSDGDDSPGRWKQPKIKCSDGAPNPAVVNGAKAIWQRMRQLEQDRVAEAVPEPSEEERKQVIEDAEALLENAELREAQVRRITEHYQAFVASVKPKTDAWRAVHKYVNDGQKRFNDYLMWDGGPDITRYQENIALSDSDDDEDNNDDDKYGKYDEGDPGDWNVCGRPERQIFALYGLLESAPKLATPITVLHSVTDYGEMPHGPKEKDYNTSKTRNNWMPTVGKAYLNKTFVSTSLGPLNDFLKGGPDPQPKLAEFYRGDRGHGCCMCAITVDADVSVVPIFMKNKDPKHYKWDLYAFNWHGFYGEEMEVLLPPGLLYVFLGTRGVTVVDEKATRIMGKEEKHRFKIFFYRAMRPPHSQQKNCADYSPIDNCSNSATVS